MNTGLWKVDSGLAAAPRPGMTVQGGECRQPGSVRAGVVQPVAQQLARLEERHVLFGDLDTVAGARVAADPRVAALDREGAKAAQFDAVAACQSRGDLIEDRRDDDLDIALIEVRVCLGKPLDELRFCHVRRTRSQMYRTVRCQTHPRASRRRQLFTQTLEEVASSTGLFLVVGLLVGLALTATDRGAEDVAEAGAGFGGAEFLHCPLLLIHFARLDRQRNAPGGAVDRGDLGIDPLADREAVGALLAAVARQFGFADKSGHAVGQRHLDAAFLDRADRRGHDIALLDAGATGFERIRLELLHAKRDALCLDIHVEGLDLDDLALAVVVHRLLSRPAPVDVGPVHHAVDIAGQPDEEAELGDVAHLALDRVADRVLLDEGVPRIRHHLLQAEADAALLRVDIEHHHLDLLAGRDDLAGMHVLFGPAHLGDVDKTLDPGLQLDEGAVIGDVRDAALELGAGRVFELDAFPWIGFELLHAERDALCLAVEVDDLPLDALPDMQGLRGLVAAQ